MIAYEIRPAHDGKCGAFLVRKVVVTVVYAGTRQAGITTMVNGREFRTMANFSDLASSERKALAKIADRLRNFPVATAAAEVAGTGCSENHHRPAVAA
ncbi:MAG: hypothetical protein H3C27_08625 [Opitutaceae bacterium]|nr:hypothetical protein [Opitutaceae bacterium]